VVFDSVSEIESIKLVDRVALFGNHKPKYTGSNLHRSNMMLNPLNLKHLNRLDNLEADVVTLNLEDAIAPDKKREALINIALFVSNLVEYKSRIVVRVNPLHLGGKEEIEYLNRFHVDAIRISKVKTSNEIKEALEILGDDKELHISLETKEAYRDLAYWGGIDSRFTTANIGILDLLADLKLPQSLIYSNSPLAEHILMEFLIRAKTAGLKAVSFMYQDYKNIDGFTKWCKRERELGFESKACMGPAQVDIANKIFAPDSKELKRAKEIKEAFESSAKKGINGFMHKEYGFIDEPIYKDALNILKSSI